MHVCVCVYQAAAQVGDLTAANAMLHESATGSAFDIDNTTHNHNHNGEDEDEDEDKGKDKGATHGCEYEYGRWQMVVDSKQGGLPTGECALACGGCYKCTYKSSSIYMSPHCSCKCHCRCNETQCKCENL